MKVTMTYFPFYPWVTRQASVTPKLNLCRLFDIMGRNRLSFIIKKGGRTNASILYEMPHQKGNEGC